MIKNKTIAFILYLILFFVLYNLLDYVLVTFITHGTYTFTIFGDAIVPTSVALVTGYEIIYKKN